MTIQTIYPDNAVIMAPLTGYTDLPFRDSIRRHGAYHMFAQMVDIGALVWGSRSKKGMNPKNVKLLERGAHEPWVGLQLLGNKPDIIGEAVDLVNQLDYQVLDLNCGCPMKKVTSRGCGAAMALDQELTMRCLDVMVAKSRFPVTAKIRILHDEDPEPTLSWARKLASTGIQALTIHGRRREMIYAGPVAFEVIKAVREELDIPVIANGGVMSAADAIELKAKTGCSSVMVARGAMGNPWLFHQLKPQFMQMVETKLAAGESLPIYQPTHEMLCAEMYQNVRELVDFHGETLAMKLARKVILSYMVGRGYQATRRDEVGRLTTWEQFVQFHSVLAAEGPSPRYLADHAFYNEADGTWF